MNNLSITSLNIGYRNKPIISDINLPDIQAGNLIAVLGANAVGKSTFLKSLAGLIKASGHIHLMQKDLLSLSHYERMRLIAYLPQSLPNPSTLVAYELVYSACRATTDWNHKKIQASVEKIFSRLSIEHLALLRMKEMSGGQRQMVGLAQVLVRQPRLLLLDEPTSALDLHWQLSVLQAVRDETAENQTIALVASHDLNLSLRFADQVLVLKKGAVLGMGSPSTLLTPDYLRIAYDIEGRIEYCSKGYPIVLADRPADKVLQ